MTSLGAERDTEPVSSRGILRCGLAAVLFGSRRRWRRGWPASSARSAWPGCSTSAPRSPCAGGRAQRPDEVDGAPGGPRLAVAVVVGGAVGPVLLAAGLGYVSAATASLLLNLELVFTTIVAALVFHEHIGRRVASGTALVVVAGVVLAWSGSAGAALGRAAHRRAPACAGRSTTASRPPSTTSPRPTSHSPRASSPAAPTWSSDSSPTARRVAAAARRARRRRFGYGVSITLWVAGARELGAAAASSCSPPRRSSAPSWRGRSSANRSTGREVVSLVHRRGRCVVRARQRPPARPPPRPRRARSRARPRRRPPRPRPPRRVHRTPPAPPPPPTVVHQHPHVPDIHHRHDHAA